MWRMQPAASLQHQLLLLCSTNAWPQQRNGGVSLSVLNSSGYQS